MSFNDFKKSYFGDEARQNRLNTYSRLGYIPRTAVDDADYTALVDDVLISIVALTAPRTITLPLAATLVSNGPNNKVKSFIIKDESGDAITHNITVQPSGGETIDGQPWALINNSYGNLQLYTNGVEFFSTYVF